MFVDVATDLLPTCWVLALPTVTFKSVLMIRGHPDGTKSDSAQVAYSSAVSCCSTERATRNGVLFRAVICDVGPHCPARPYWVQEYGCGRTF